MWSSNYQHVFYKEGTPEGVTDWMQASQVDITSESATDINFELGSGNSISGTVTVPEGGSLNNLWVNAGSESAGSWGNAMVNQETGTYEIAGLASAADFKVDIWSQDYGYQVYNGKKNWEDATLVSTVSGDVTGINFNLSTGKSISGTIKDSNGNGIADAWVNVWSESARCGRGEPTDSQGNFLIKNLDAASDYKLDVFSQEYGMVSYKEGADNNSTTDWAQATLIDVTQGSVSGINVTLTAGQSISGNVTNDSGEPLSGVWVNAWSEISGGNGTETDASGNYIIKGLPAAADLVVDVWAEGYTHVFYDNTTDYMDATRLSTESGNVEDIDFVLSSGNSISGTVTAGGNPVANIWVNAWSETTGCWGGGNTNSAGIYTVTGLAPASDYVVDVWSETYAHQFYNQKTDWMDADKVDVSSGNKTGIDFVLSTGNYIAGTITLPQGDSDYFKIWVNAWSDDTGSGNGCPVKYDGTYKIAGLVPGTGYKVQVQCEDYVDVFYKDGANTTTDWEEATGIDISTGNVDGINLTLGSGASISGTVTLNESGQARVWVDAWSSTAGAWGGDETDADGNYTITGLVAADDYVVSTWSWAYINDSQTGVSAGDTDVDLVLSSGISITGNLRKGAEALGGVWVDAWSSELAVGAGGLSNVVGDFEIVGLKPNTTYTVSAAPGSHGFVSEQVYVDSSGNMYINGDATTGTFVSEVDLNITTGDSISGTVTKADGGGFITDTEVIVVAFDASDGSFYNSTTASRSDGTYEITNLPDGNYKIFVKAQGYDILWYNSAADYNSATEVSPGSSSIDFQLVVSAQ